MNLWGPHCESRVARLTWGGGSGQLSIIQGCRKLPRSGAAEGRQIEVCSGDHSVRSAEKNFRLHFQLSGCALVALSYFED